MLCQKCARVGVRKAGSGGRKVSPNTACPGSFGELALRAAQIPQLVCRHVPGGNAGHRYGPSHSRRTRLGHVPAVAG